MNMDIKKFREIFGKEIFEIEFNYRGKGYHIGIYYIKNLFKKGKPEYWFYEHNSSNIYKLDTLEELLDIQVDGVKLRDFIDEVVITEMY
jgi:hypothetical protein